MRLTRFTRNWKKSFYIISLHEWQLRNLLGTLCQSCLFQWQYPVLHGHSVSTAADFEHQPWFLLKPNKCVGSVVWQKSLAPTFIRSRLNRSGCWQSKWHWNLLGPSISSRAGAMQYYKKGTFLTHWTSVSWHVANTGKNQQHCVRCLIAVLGPWWPCPV